MFSSWKKSEICKQKNLKKKIFDKKKNKKIQERKKQQQQCVSTVRRVVKSKKGRGRGLIPFGFGSHLLIPKYIRSASAKALKT
jgi:hypothetical protein